MKKLRNLEYEKKFRAYLFSFDFNTHKEICKNLNVKPKLNIKIDLSKSSILELLKGKTIEAGKDTIIKGYCLDKSFLYKGKK